MAVIRVLPEAVANKIAAGEVIERPASVLKELLENALDAGARSIEAEIQRGGIRLIRVTDDGCGMSRDDAAAAFGRHATSKLDTLEDLSSIASFGFRGEALPSIAAVSRTELHTGRPGDAAGTTVAVEGGRRHPPRERAPMRGTSVEVRDLFFNTPARRKFLKSDATELGHALDAAARLALAAPAVRFRVVTSGGVALDAPPAPDLASRARDVLGPMLADQLVPVEGVTDGIRLTGAVGKPRAARGNRAGQHLYVNRRWVRAPQLSFALQRAYEGMLMHGRYPVAVLFLDVDPARLDVNVHPTKQQVRIADESALASWLTRAVAQALRASGGMAAPLAPARSRPDARASIAADAPSGAPQGVAGPRPGATRLFTLPASGPAAVLEPDAGVPAPAPEPARHALGITRILGQIHRMVIVAETDEGLILVDQHAAHERVMYEALLANVRSANPERQDLLLEQVVDFPPRQMDVFRESRALLERVGFQLEEFGPRAVRVRSVPSILGGQDPAAFLSAYVDRAEEGAGRAGLADEQAAIAAMIACKRKSVRAHDPMAPEALRALLARLGRCEHPFSCPHGRPTILTYTIGDLERQFKRT